jgi:mono/diheme cytochrome c family protein
MRKVGPSLYRISEKTNETWARKWVANPRGFRLDTRMPHFYGLSTSLPGELPEDQKDFAGAEIHSLVYYLFDTSSKYLQGKDFYRTFAEERKKTLDKRNEAAKLLLQLAKKEDWSDSDKKKVAAFSTNKAFGEDETKKFLELAEKDSLNESERKDVASWADDLLSDAQRKELAQITRNLELAQIPTPIAKQLEDETGALVPLPAASDAKGLEQGRALFTERGCLACHTHQGTTKKIGSLPGVDSEAQFGPNLSLIAAKLGASTENKESARRWLIQWILKPTIHFPRTRMPNVHLTVEDAAKIADWLLSQESEEVKKWRQADNDVPAPTPTTLTELARVYLAKGAHMTKKDVDDS